MSSHDINEEMEDIRNEIFSYDASFVEYTIEGHSDSDIEKIVENVINQFKDLVLDVVGNHITHETRTIANMENSKINRQEYKEPTTKNDLGVDCISRAEVLKLMKDNWHTHNGDWAMQESMDDIRALPAVTPQEPILDKIRAEIERGKTGLDIEFNGGIDYALSIIDKYKAESEDK